MAHLHAYLISSGTTQAVLADRLGVSRGYLSELVGGSKKPGLYLAFAIERETSGAVPAISWVPDQAPGVQA